MSEPKLKTADRAKDSRLRQCYKKTLEEYNAQKAEQNNCCAICPRSFTDFQAYQDHDHDCCAAPRKRVGKYCGKCNRGLVCFLCNKKAIASIEFMCKVGIDPRKVIAYLDRWTEIIKAKGGYAPKPAKSSSKKRVSSKQKSVRHRVKTNSKTGTPLA